MLLARREWKYFVHTRYWYEARDMWCEVKYREKARVVIANVMEKNMLFIMLNQACNKAFIKFKKAPKPIFQKLIKFFNKVLKAFKSSSEVYQSFQFNQSKAFVIFWTWFLKFIKAFLKLDFIQKCPHY